MAAIVLKEINVTRLVPQPLTPCYSNQFSLVPGQLGQICFQRRKAASTCLLVGDILSNSWAPPAAQDSSLAGLWTWWILTGDPTIKGLIEMKSSSQGSWHWKHLLCHWYTKELPMPSQCPVHCECTNQLLWGKVTNTLQGGQNQNPNLSNLPAWMTVLSVDPKDQNFRQCTKINNVQIFKFFLFRICQFSGWAGPPLLYVAGTAVQLELGGIDSSGRPPPWATSCRPTRPPTQRLPKVQQHLPSLRCPPQKELSKVSKAELDLHSLVHKRNESMVVNIDS